MLAEFDTSLPSVRQVQNLIKEASQVEVKLTTGDIITGKIIWQDSQCLLIGDDSSERTTIWKQAIAYMKAKG